MKATAVILVKVPGHLPVKTRLAATLGESAAHAVFAEMLEHSVALARHFDPTPTLAFSPPEAHGAKLLGPFTDVHYLPVPGSDGAACLEAALQLAYVGRPLVALGGDAPDLPATRLAEALAALERADAGFVPSGDGGFSALVMRRPLPGLAAGFRFGAGDALGSLRAYFESLGLRTHCTEPWPDVDTPADLAAWRARAAARLG